jgi:hypothetical protein
MALVQHTSSSATAAAAATTRVSPGQQDPLLLVKRVGIDALAAATAAFFVAPFITIVDRSVIENASGTRKLKVAFKDLSLSLVKNPFQFIVRKEFRYVYGVYCGTYFSANIADSFCEWHEMDNQIPKFLSTTAANMSLGIMKDRAFARMFGTLTSTARFPLMSIAFFTMRDSVTIAASFNAPKVVAEKLKVKLGMEKERSLKVAQLLCPISIQFLSTPMHLMALDLYNNQKATTSQHFKFVRREYIKSTLARICRIAPAFGIGAIGNRSVRLQLRSYHNTTYNI